MNKNQKYFFISSFLIILVGIIMVYSSSYMYAKETMGSSTHFLLKQIAFLIVGAGFGFIISKTKFNFWYTNIYWINAFFVIMLAVTLTPYGSSMKGSSRWLSIFGFSLQPGEIVKYTILFASIKFFSEYKKYESKELLKYAANILMAPIIFIIQPDFGSFSIVVCLLLFNCFLCEIPKKYFFGFLGTGLIAVGTLLFAAPYRVKRLLVFLDPWSDPQNSGFQIIQSYLAFANGHFFGTGIGNSHEKLFYLPEAYNDFIFSVLGEELGFIGLLAVVLLFISFIYWGLKMSVDKDLNSMRLNSIFIAAVIFCIGLQAFLNMGVVLGILPTKGLNLPFISYGGSSLIANLIALGFIMSAYKDQSPNSFAYAPNEYNINENLYNR